MNNCGICYNRGCSYCRPELRAAENIAASVLQTQEDRREVDRRAAWRTYVVAYMAKGFEEKHAFNSADMAMRLEDDHFKAKGATK